MNFNARWGFQQLATDLNKLVPDLLAQLLDDFGELVRVCPVYRLVVTSNGNCFRLLDRYGADGQLDSVAGLYPVFTVDAVAYFGEANDLRRRQLVDPDNTADSGKTFTNQGRAVLKFLLHHSWDGVVGLSPLFIQLYPATAQIEKRGRTFDECYRVSEFSKSLEGALSLFVQRYHPQMNAKAVRDGLISTAG